MILKVNEEFPILNRAATRWPNVGKPAWLIIRGRTFLFEIYIWY
jgi:hypothetical protein